MFNELNIKDTPHLWFVRRGFFTREYDLTDRTEIYGTLTYDWLTRREATAQTVGHRWAFGFWSIFSRTLTITDETGTIIGEATREYLSRTYTLTLKSGFRARFYRPSFFSREYIWESEGYGKMVTLENNFPFALDNDVIIAPNQAPASIIPLLIFFGMHLSIYRRGRRAVR